MIAKIKLNGFVEQHPEETRTPTASIASFSCQPYSISYENISSLPNRQRDRLMSQSSCSPRFVIPGFMKAGSSYLYDLITSHPRALKALRGVAFKETGCYDPHFLKTIPATSRIECFPFVERHEVSVNQSLLSLWYCCCCFFESDIFCSLLILSMISIYLSICWAACW